MTAKEMLMRYLYAVREAKEMELQIAKLRLKYAAPSAIKYSDMPTSHDANHDLSDYAARLDELTDMLVKRYSKCIGIEIDIVKYDFPLFISKGKVIDFNVTHERSRTVQIIFLT